MMNKICDVLVVGSGAAGLINALALAKAGFTVLVATKDAVTESSSAYAQGGVAVPLLEEDSVEQHIQDTLQVGGESCNQEIVEHYLRAIPTHIERLASWGVPFLGYQHGKVVNPSLLARESGHSRRRVLRIGSDLSGKNLMKALWEISCREPRISISQGTALVELFRDAEGCCAGGLFLDINHNLFPIISDFTVLASGGYSKVYAKSTNPEVSTGDGIAAAVRLGAAVRNMRLVQFHPTVLNHPRYFLISESLRGEGGLLINQQNERFLKRYAPEQLELAPRAIVSQAVWEEEKRNGPIYLDLRHLGRDFLVERFPGIYKGCQSFGFDLSKEPVPVTTAAHYSIGGLAVDRDCKTKVPHLWAIGEVSNTGLHGADRLASNSLLECIVSAFLTAESIQASERRQERDERYNTPLNPIDHNDSSWGTQRQLLDQIAQLRQKMWDLVAFKREKSALEQFYQELKELEVQLPTHPSANQALNQLRNAVIVDRLVLENCLEHCQANP